MVFKNKHGQEPSPPLPGHTPTLAPPEALPGQVQIKGKNRFLQRMGHESPDLKQCQAPVQRVLGVHARCAMPAVSVMVENQPRDGRICAMSLCEFHHNLVLRSHGPDYAAFTPLMPPATPSKMG